MVAAIVVVAGCNHSHNDAPARPPTPPLPMTSTPETHATFADDAGLQSPDPMSGVELATDAGVGGATRDGGAATGGDGGTTAADAGTRRGK